MILRMRRGFPIVAVIGGGLALLVAIVAIRLALTRIRHRQLETTLGVEFERDAHRRWPRPAFGEVREGVFQDLAEPGRTQLATMQREYPSCWEARERGLTERPDDPCLAWMNLNWPAAAIVLSATHARLGSWDLHDLETQGDTTDGLSNAARVATTHLLLDQSAGRNPEAVQTCLEVLALGREAAITGTVYGVALGNAIVRGALNACATALSLATVETKAAAAGAIDAIEKGLPPASRMYHSEALVQVASLLRQAPRGGWGGLLHDDALIESIRRYEADSRVADDADPARLEALRRNEWSRRLSPNRGAREAPAASSYLARDLALRARLRLLQQAAVIGAAHDRTGQWLAPPPPLVLSAAETSPGQATLRDPSVPSERAPENIHGGLPWTFEVTLGRKP
jgi:hypothetical protein